MKDLDDTKAPLLDHLIELRRRLLWCVAALAVAFFVCLYFAKPIFAVLVQPLLAAGQGKVIYTDVFEAFFVEVKVALFAALMVSFPVIATQIVAVRRAGPVSQGKARFPAVPADDPVLLRRRSGLRLFRGDAMGADSSCSASRATSAGSSRRRCPGSAII